MAATPPWPRRGRAPPHPGPCPARATGDGPVAPAVPSALGIAARCSAERCRGRGGQAGSRAAPCCDGRARGGAGTAARDCAWQR